MYLFSTIKQVNQFQMKKIFPYWTDDPKLLQCCYLCKKKIFLKFSISQRYAQYLGHLGVLFRNDFKKKIDTFRIQFWHIVKIRCLQHFSDIFNC